MKIGSTTSAILLVFSLSIPLIGCLGAGGDGHGDRGGADVLVNVTASAQPNALQLGQVAEIDNLTIDVFKESDLTLIGGEVDFSQLDGLASLRLAADVDAYPGLSGQWLSTIRDLPLEEVRVVAYGRKADTTRIFRGAADPFFIAQGIDTPVTLHLDAIDDGYGIAIPRITFMNIPDVIEDEFVTVLVALSGQPNEFVTFLFSSADGNFDTIEAGGDGSNPGDVTANPADPLNLAAGRITLDAVGDGTITTVYTDVSGTAGLSSQLTIKATNSQGNDAVTPADIFVLPTPPKFSRETDIVLAPDAGAADQFGQAVGIDGDHIIVGAWKEADGGSAAGAAYIFKRVPGSDTWDAGIKLVEPVPAANNQFGRAVAISGNFAVVGAWLNDDPPGNNGGVAYIFQRDPVSDAWDAGTPIAASNGGGGDRFGGAVAISGTYLIVGADREDTGGNNAGMAYVFKWDGLGWTEQTPLVAPDAQAANNFGTSVAIKGDLAIVGAPGESTGGAGAGAAYIYQRDPGSDTWDSGTKIVAAAPAAGDAFGSSVSIDGNYAIVGAYLQDGGGTSAGAAYIFFWNGATWTQQVQLASSDLLAGDQFGVSVSIDGDIALVGANTQDSAGSNAGAAYIFERNGATWPEIAKVLASDAQGGDQFGWSVSLSGGYAVVGARNEDTGGSNAGAVYAFK